MNLKKILDSSKTDALVESVTQKDVQDLYNYGVLEVSIPPKTSKVDFKRSLLSRLNDLWGEQDVNFDYGDVEFSTEISGDTLTVFAN